jgi:hypothetical protein
MTGMTSSAAAPSSSWAAIITVISAIPPMSLGLLSPAYTGTTGAAACAPG